MFKPEKVILENPLKTGTLVYTLDGSEPEEKSTQPILYPGIAC
ncbi:chitobiase/beta-hexosaminidase C-terminal domain-containing protein [bacterium]|nr:chitobiase/beta-hexosaminidase C-terminal domain-containing protein [bacterium]